MWTFVGKVISLLFNTLSRFVIAFLPRSKHLLISWLQYCPQWFWSPRKWNLVNWNDLKCLTINTTFKQPLHAIFLWYLVQFSLYAVRLVWGSWTLERLTELPWAMLPEELGFEPWFSDLDVLPFLDRSIRLLGECPHQFQVPWCIRRDIKPGFCWKRICVFGWEGRKWCSEDVGN